MTESALAAFDLRGKRALVSGDAGPIRDALRDALAEAGAQLLADERSAAEADALVTCFDLREAAPFVETSDEHLDRLLEHNLRAPARLIRDASKGMLARGGGRVVVVHSLLAQRGVENTAVYAATQAALAQLIRSLSIEWARSAIRINGIGVGWFEGDPLVPEPERLARFVASRRLGRPDDLAALVVYLASDRADMMTGQTIYVDGGALSHA
jgi:NAD(P)-dependent dehydrogenase (short-subunit alcohol dehydrogenase family)